MTQDYYQIDHMKNYGLISYDFPKNILQKSLQ